jgi:predicted transcriptional regulator
MQFAHLSDLTRSFRLDKIIGKIKHIGSRRGFLDLPGPYVIRRSVFLSKKDAERMEEVARKRNVRISKIIRVAVDAYLAKPQSTPRRDDLGGLKANFCVMLSAQQNEGLRTLMVKEERRASWLIREAILSYLSEQLWLSGV